MKFFLIIFFIIFVVNIFVFIYYKKRESILNSSNYHTRGCNSYKNRNCIFPKSKDMFLNNKIMTFRGIPCNGDIFMANWIIYNYNLGKRDEDFFGAVLLKWIKDGNIKLDYNLKNNSYDILFVVDPVNCNEIEEKMYRYMFQASFGNEKEGYLLDYRLSVSEFKEWCKNNYGKIVEWFSSSLDYAIDENIKNSRIVAQKRKDHNNYVIKYIVDETINEEAVKIAGLKKFFQEFTIINERDKMEVMVFDDYLIFATMFGVAEEVFNDFEKIYPEILGITDIKLFSSDDLMFACDWDDDDFHILKKNRY